jgi:hypothetical protein
VFAPPEAEKTIAEWMRSEHMSEALGYRITQSQLSTKHFGTLQITVVRNEPTVIPEGTILVYFFETEGRPIKGSLIYRGKRQAGSFEGVFRSILEDLEPLPRH